MSFPRVRMNEEQMNTFLLAEDYPSYCACCNNEFSSQIKQVGAQFKKTKRTKFICIYCALELLDYLTESSKKDILSGIKTDLWFFYSKN